jgi:hypothetical protein
MKSILQLKSSCLQVLSMEGGINTHFHGYKNRLWLSSPETELLCQEYEGFQDMLPRLVNSEMSCPRSLFSLVIQFLC